MWTPGPTGPHRSDAGKHRIGIHRAEPTFTGKWPGGFQIFKTTGTHRAAKQRRLIPGHHRSSSDMNRISTLRSPGETVANRHELRPRWRYGDFRLGHGVSQRRAVVTPTLAGRTTVWHCSSRWMPVKLRWSYTEREHERVFSSWNSLIICRRTVQIECERELVQHFVRADDRFDCTQSELCQKFARLFCYELISKYFPCISSTYRNVYVWLFLEIQGSNFSLRRLWSWSRMYNIMDKTFYIERKHGQNDKADKDYLFRVFAYKLQNKDLLCVWLYQRHDSKWPNVISQASKRRAASKSLDGFQRLIRALFE